MPGTSTTTHGNAPRNRGNEKVARLPEKGEVMAREPHRVGKAKSAPAKKRAARKRPTGARRATKRG